MFNDDEKQIIKISLENTVKQLSQGITAYENRRHHDPEMAAKNIMFLDNEIQKYNAVLSKL